MKLRNKKTGKVTDNIFIYDGFICVDVWKGDSGTYASLAELNEEWEDYKPTEALIKDEKVRKAVRAWAEANKINRCKCNDEIHCITFETERGMFISFEYADPIPPGGNYTITELCGEEE